MIRLLTLLALLLPTVAFADGITIGDPWSPAAPPGARAHAAYMTVTNTGATPRALIGVRAESYGMAHLHESRDNDGIATMAPVHQIEIAPGASIALAPGGFHIMLMMPQAPASEPIALTLVFADGEEVAVRAGVRPHNAPS